MKLDPITRYILEYQQFPSNKPLWIKHQNIMIKEIGNKIDKEDEKVQKMCEKKFSKEPNKSRHDSKYNRCQAGPRIKNLESLINWYKTRGKIVAKEISKSDLELSQLMADIRWYLKEGLEARLKNLKKKWNM